MTRSLSVGLTLLAATLAGCVGRVDTDTEEVPRELVVFAAASTTDAVGEIAGMYQKETGNHVHTSYAGSSTLAQQIEAGADAHVFLSANVKWADYLDQKSLVARRRDLLGNRLVIILPAEDAVPVKSPEDLRDPRIKHLALADPEGVPAGIYAREALTKLGLWDEVSSKVVAAPDVRAALSYVETGAAEAGMVYATDAAVSKSVRVAVQLPEDVTEPIVYPLALLRAGEKNPAAEAFCRYMATPAAAEVFRRWGFTVIAQSEASP